MDLFDAGLEEKLQKTRPLAARVRPHDLNQFVGQEHLVGENSVLRLAIEKDQLKSAIFYGPPGSGKTTLAEIIAKASSATIKKISAISSNVKELRGLIAEANDNLKFNSQRTIVFIDEIHRFNKSQQDALLGAVEDGVIILIGATTENPYFEVNSPLLSRAIIYEFKKLTDGQIQKIIESALVKDDFVRNKKISLAPEALEHLVNKANGDARYALNSLEASALISENGRITLEAASTATQKQAAVYDKDGDTHYDVISAFIKSLRGSDAQAAIYWLARMIEAGEDPKFIVRRMIIFASEDIGNADPQALSVASAAAFAVDFVGLPEARLNLAQAAIYLAKAPKDNTVIKAIDSALKDVKEKRHFEVPDHLKDAHYSGAKNLGRGADYKYPHNFKDAKVEQDYLPKGAKTDYLKPKGKN